MISDDLSSLFDKAKGGVVFRQGRVTAWDAATGENTIVVAGAAIANVPSLTSEAATLQPDDVVMLLASGTTWLVLGKVTTPGDPDTVPTWSSDLEALSPLQEVAQNTSGTTIGGVTLGTSTADTGRRIEIVQDPDNRINFYSGEADEVAPAALNTDGADLHLIGPIYDEIHNPTGQVFLRGSRGMADLAYADATLHARGGNALLSVNDGAGSGAVVSVIGPDAAGAFEVPEGVIVRTDPGDRVSIGSLAGELVITDNAVTGADLSDPSNVFPANPQPVAASSDTAVAATLSTTYAAGSPVCGLAFTAPPSGKVYLTVGGRIRLETNNNTMYLSFEIRSGAAIGSGTVLSGWEANNGRAVAVAGNGTGVTYLTAGASREFLVTGLTPGASYNVRTMHACQSSTATGTVFNRDLLVKPVL